MCEDTGAVACGASTDGLHGARSSDGCPHPTRRPKERFRPGLSRVFSLGLEGAFGDEGPANRASLEALRKTLDQWDTTIRTYESAMRADRVGAVSVSGSAPAHGSRRSLPWIEAVSKMRSGSSRPPRSSIQPAPTSTCCLGSHTVGSSATSSRRRGHCNRLRCSSRAIRCALTSWRDAC